MRAGGSVRYVVEHEKVPASVLHHVFAFVLKCLLNALVAWNARGCKEPVFRQKVHTNVRSLSKRSASGMNLAAACSNSNLDVSCTTVP